jgi:hypothetical protein
VHIFIRQNNLDFESATIFEFFKIELFWLKFDVLGKFGGVKNIFAKNLIEF